MSGGEARRCRSCTEREPENAGHTSVAVSRFRVTCSGYRLFRVDNPVPGHEGGGRARGHDRGNETRHRRKVLFTVVLSFRGRRGSLGPYLSGDVADRNYLTNNDNPGPGSPGVSDESPRSGSRGGGPESGVNEGGATGTTSHASRIEPFERSVADLCGVEHAVAVNPPHSVATLTLQLAGVGHGDQVFVPAFDALDATVATLELGAEPVFVDCDPVTLTMGPLDLNNKIQSVSNAAAVVVTHAFGHPALMRLIRNVATVEGVAVVEDVTSALGATYRGGPVGGLGDVGYVTGQSSDGEDASSGGVVLTDRKAIAQAVRAIPQTGARAGTPSGSELLGITPERPEDASSWEATLRARITQRREQTRRLTNRLASNRRLIVPARRSDADPVYRQYVLRTRKRDRIRTCLAEKDIETERPVPAHRHHEVRPRLSGQPSLFGAESVGDQMFGLSLGGPMSDRKLDVVCSLIEECLVAAE